MVDLTTTNSHQAIKIGESIRDLVQSDNLSERDELALFAPGKDGRSLSIRVDWTTDHNAVSNAIYMPFVPEASDGTALYELVIKAMDRFDNTFDAQRHLVIFSNGLDELSSSAGLEQIKQKARYSGVRVHTILLPEIPNSPQNLKELALEGNGLYLELESDQPLAGLWNSFNVVKLYRDVILSSNKLTPTSTIIPAYTATPNPTSTSVEVEAACPWLYIYDGRSFNRIIEVLRNVRGKSKEIKEMTHLEAVPIIDGKIIFKLVEEKEEISYIDEFYIMIDGTRLPLNTEESILNLLSNKDQNYLLMHQGESVKLTFSPPLSLRDRRSVDITIVTSGYYIPLENNNIQ